MYIFLPLLTNNQQKQQHQGYTCQPVLTRTLSPVKNWRSFVEAKSNRPNVLADDNQSIRIWEKTLEFSSAALPYKVSVPSTGK